LGILIGENREWSADSAAKLRKATLNWQNVFINRLLKDKLA
jgi:hypothetical protein